MALVRHEALQRAVPFRARSHERGGRHAGSAAVALVQLVGAHLPQRAAADGEALALRVGVPRRHTGSFLLKRLEDREQKYPLICHAEENAIMHAARIGISLKGNTAYVTWPPCSRCTRSLIQAGVNEVVFPADVEVPERWQTDFDIAIAMMNEAEISVRQA